MRKFTGLVLILFLIGSQPVIAAAGGGGGGGTSGGRAGGSTSQKTPRQIATSHYNKGLKYRDKAWKYEKKAAEESDEKKSAKLLTKAQKEYKKAIKKYEKAIKVRPAFYQAHSSLGYALRKTGDMERSLMAYDNSIGINAFYPESIEYRAETYLQLNRFEEVKVAYMELFEDHPREYADQLMAAMDLWVQQNGENGNEDVKSFSAWFRERKEIAGNTVSLSQPSSKSWDDKI